MQITLNKVPFDIEAIDDRLRDALLADPLIATGVSREVWAWDGREGKHLVPVTPTQGLPLPTGLVLFVPQPGTGPLRKAEGPTRRMAERLMAAVGAKTLTQVMQALARVTGLPQKSVPLDAFEALKPFGPFRVVMEIQFAALRMANASRNLEAFVLIPGLVAFRHVADDVPEGAPAPGSIRPGFVIPPLNAAGHALRRLAIARRLTEMQAALGGTQPADLPTDDPRRLEIARLGAEWRVLQARPQAPRAA